MGQKPVCLAAIGDSHINKLMSLLKPGLAVDKGDEFSIARRWIWARHVEYVRHFWKMSVGCKRVLALVGDIGEFNVKDYSNQIISTSKDTIKDMVVETLSPILSIMDDVYVIGGTDSHAGKGCEFEKWIADDIKAPFMWNMLADINGVYVDIAHHTSAGRTPWTNGNAAVRLAAKTVMHYAGERIPQYVFRFHVHHYEDSHDNIKGCRAVIGPCWTFHDEYENKLGLCQKLPDIGGIILRCENGKGELDVWTRQPRRQEPLKI